MIRRVSVRGISLHDGKLLCVRLKSYDGSLRSQGGDYWCLPGGGLEDGEALLDGIDREMIEETGVRPSVGRLLYIQQFAHGDKEFLEFFFHIKNAADYLHLDLNATSHGALEIAEIAFIDPKNARVLPEFLATEPLTDISKQGGPTRIISRF